MGKLFGASLTTVTRSRTFPLLWPVGYLVGELAPLLHLPILRLHDIRFVFSASVEAFRLYLPQVIWA